MPGLPCNTHRFSLFAVSAAAMALGVVGPQREARADEVSSDGKGIIGVGLLGAEAVTITESIIGVKEPWAYIVGGLVGAGGGAVGGYFIEQGSSDGKLPGYLLAAGMAMVIPAVVLSLNATRYTPEAGTVEDHAPTGPTPEPGSPAGSIGEKPGAAPPPPASAPPTPPPQSLLDIRGGVFRVGLPVPTIKPVYSVAEQQQYGIVREGTEVRMPVLHVTF
jgi:hypothetical protein